MDRPQWNLSRLFSIAARSALTGVALWVMAPAAGSASSADPTHPADFGFAEVQTVARLLAFQPYRPDAARPDEGWLKLDYDRYRDIRSDRTRNLWAGSGTHFQADFFHTGFIYNRLVEINELADRRPGLIPYRPELFHFGALWKNRPRPPTGGFAGWRLFTDLYGNQTFADEVAVFLGASYFRAPGRHRLYGLSARALAIDTVGGPTGEEFPTFQRFWLERPAADDKIMTTLALSDSPSAVGAWRFRIAPGETTDMEVEGVVFLRRPVTLLGITPFSSMFWYGENSWPRPPDFRPEVHDSDGLLMRDEDGLWTWRPLHVSREMRHAVFDLRQGSFGLMQRDENFTHYQDLEAAYHRRTSAWVEPLAGWPGARLHLIELTTGEESWDNIVLFCEPGRQPARGQPLSFAYRLRWGASDLLVPAERSQVTATRHSIDFAGSSVLFIVDFSREPGLADHAAPPHLVAAADPPAQLAEALVMANPETGGWRVSLRVKLDRPLRFDEREGRARVKCRLERRNRPVSEQWDYLWIP